MKKKWEEPQIMVEAFEANEYVAACWKVGCSHNTSYGNQMSSGGSNAPYGNQWGVTEGPYDDVFSHDGDCRHASNNYFQANGTNIKFKFENNSNQGNLGGGFDSWKDVNGNGIVDQNDVVYWHTSNGSRTWNHWGYVETVDSSRVNHS